MLEVCEKPEKRPKKNSLPSERKRVGILGSRQARVSIAHFPAVQDRQVRRNPSRGVVLRVMARIHIHMHTDIRIRMGVFPPGRTDRRFLRAEGAQAGKRSAVCMKPHMGTGTRMVWAGLAGLGYSVIETSARAQGKRNNTARNVAMQIFFLHRKRFHGPI